MICHGHFSDDLQSLEILCHVHDRGEAVLTVRALTARGSLKLTVVTCTNQPHTHAGTPAVHTDFMDG